MLSASEVPLLSRRDSDSAFAYLYFHQIYFVTILIILIAKIDKNGQIKNPQSIWIAANYLQNGAEGRNCHIVNVFIL
jgi:hypothetical protein